MQVRGSEPGLALPDDQNASGRTLGDDELERLAEVIRSGVLTSTKGTQVAELEQRFVALLGLPHAVACSSGTAAVHAAVAAVDPEPGDEIVTTPITDMGALAPILYQGAVPVFADVDPSTGNVTASVEARLSERTVAIMATHLFGNPCEMGAITALADARGLPVIEDCAQAFLARSDGHLVGTIGAIGCFSLQQGKQMTTGEGGIVATAETAAHARRMRLFVNKAWPYGEADPDHEFLALNSRLSELQGAVANVQLDKLEPGVANRIAMADLLTRELVGVPGVETPVVRDGDVATWWRYPLRVDPDVIPGGPTALAAELRLGGVASAPRYIQKPAFACRVFTEQRTFGNSRWPFSIARPEALDYDAARFPGTFAYLDSVLVLPWNERYAEDHVRGLADAVRAAAASLAGTGR